MKEYIIKHKEFFTALGINLLFLILALIFCDQKYEVSDDFMMDAILSGAYGDDYNPFISYTFAGNIILGWILVLLCKLIPKVSFFFVYIVILGFLSLTAVDFICLKKKYNLFSIALCFIFSAFFSDDLFILIQYTKTASIAIMAGGLLLISGFSTDKKDKRPMVTFGILLSIMGTILRSWCISLALVFLCIYAVSYIVKGISEHNHTLVKKTLLSLLTLAIMCYGLTGIDYAVRQAIPTEKQFITDTRTRSKLVDVFSLGYPTVKDDFTALNLSENDYYMVDGWNFIDRDIFTKPVLDKLIESKVSVCNKYSRDISNILEFIFNRKYLTYTSVIGMLIIYIILTLCGTKETLLGTLTLASVISLCGYCFFNGRVAYRVEFSIFICAAALMLVLIDIPSTVYHSDIAWLRRLPMYIILLLMVAKVPLYIPDTAYKSLDDETYQQYVTKLFSSSLAYDVKKYRACVNKRRPHSDLIDLMETDSDHYYLVDFSTGIQCLYFNYKPWERLPIGYFKNTYNYLGGVNYAYTGSDACNALNGLDPRNPYSSIIDERFVLVDNYNYIVKTNYIGEHYNSNISITNIDTIDGLMLWKFFISD